MSSSSAPKHINPDVGEWETCDPRLHVQREFGRLKRHHADLEAECYCIAQHLQSNSKQLHELQQEKWLLRDSHAELVRSIDSRALQTNLLQDDVVQLREHLHAVQEERQKHQAKLHQEKARLPGLAGLAAAVRARHGSSSLDRDKNSKEEEDRAVAMAELRYVLKQTVEGAKRCTYGAVLGTLLGCAWTVVFCYELQLATGARQQWIVVMVFCLVCILITVLMESRRMCLTRPVKTKDQYDLDEVMFGQHPVRLANENEHLEYHVKLMCIASEQLLVIRRLLLLRGILVGTLQIICLLLFTIWYPLGCSWAAVTAQNELTGEFIPVPGGNVQCRDQETFLGAPSVLYLAYMLPLIAALSWYCIAGRFTQHGAEILLQLARRREEVLVSPAAVGSDLFTMFWERMWLNINELLHRAHQYWWFSIQMIVDCCDCVDFWATLCMQAEVFLPRVQNSPGNGSPMFVLRSHSHVGLGIQLQLLWWFSFVQLMLAILQTLMAPYFNAVFCPVNEMRVTPDNRHKIFLLFLKLQLRMPNRNLEALCNSLRSLFLLDLPFVVLRVLIWCCVGIPVSPLFLKNIGCSAYYIAVVMKFCRWRAHALRLRKDNRPLVKSFEREIQQIAQCNNLDATDIYDRLGSIYDEMEQPEEEFLEAYFQDLHGIPVASIAHAAGIGAMPKDLFILGYISMPSSP